MCPPVASHPCGSRPRQPRAPSTCSFIILDIRFCSTAWVGLRLDLGCCDAPSAFLHFNAASTACLAWSSRLKCRELFAFICVS